jgi:hypothetical protein
MIRISEVRRLLGTLQKGKASSQIFILVVWSPVTHLVGNSIAMLFFSIASISLFVASALPALAVSPLQAKLLAPRPYNTRTLQAYIILRSSRSSTVATPSLAPFRRDIGSVFNGGRARARRCDFHTKLAICTHTNLLLRSCFSRQAKRMLNHTWAISLTGQLLINMRRQLVAR